MEMEESGRWERLLRGSLAARQRLEEDVEGLKFSLVMAGASNLKSDPEQDFIFLPFFFCNWSYGSLCIELFILMKT